MTSSAAAYPDWKAPAAEGEILLWPQAGQIVADAADNHRRLASESKAAIQNVPLHEARRRMREAAGIQADERALFSGHQTELYHPGVWAKDALTTAAAQATDGARAWHLAVDTDRPKHLDLRWPEGSTPITDDPGIGSAEWSGLLHAPTTDYERQLQTTFSAAARKWDFRPASLQLGFSLAEGSLSQSLTVAIAGLDRALGLKCEYAMASSLFATEPYLLLAAHLLGRAAEVAGAYNAALANYRKAHRIRTASRPMPDLSVAADKIESPFWLDDLVTGRRERAAVRRIEGKWSMELGGERIAFDASADGWQAAAALKQFLAHRQLRLSPRALTLTLFARLLLADQFVHGIGGGRYDQVTDRLIADLFGIEPPKFSVTTATLYFPGAASERRVCLPCLKQEGHRIEHSLLGAEKMEMVRAIEAQPRYSIARRTIFSRMHTRLRAAAVEHPAMMQWRQRFESGKRRRELEESIFDRELFFGVQPVARLQGLVEQYREQFTAK